MISIIIPVYNVEDYLRECLDSIIDQKHQDNEIILVDDGSIDKSPEICDEYCSRYSQIHVVHKKNGGVSSARNAGLDIAKGEYIAFIDADDSVDRDFLSIDGCEADVIEKGYCVIDKNSKIIAEHNKLGRTLYTEDEILRFFVNKRNNALWDKIIAKRIIGDNRFNENVKIGEDFLFFLSLIPNIKSYTFSPIGKYFYRVTATSAMSAVNKDLSKRLKVIEDNISNILECNKIVRNENLIYSIIYKSYFPYYLRNRQSLTEKQVNQYNSIIRGFSIKRICYLSIPNKMKTFVKLLLAVYYRL